MKLSTRGDYAVRALLELALSPVGDPVPVSTLAERTGIPPKYLEQLFKDLRAAKLLQAQRGQRGGYVLARGADQITVAEIIRVMEGPLAPTLCASRTRYAPCSTFLCPNEQECVLRNLWSNVRDAISDILDNTTLAELAEQQRSSRDVPRYSI